VTDDMLISYALGHLTPEEEAAVELHLQRTPQDALRVAAYLDTLADLVFELPPEPLPQGGEEALLARVRGASQPRRIPPVIVLPAPPVADPVYQPPVWRPNVLGALAAAAVVALLYLGVANLSMTEPVRAWQLQRYASQAGARSYPLSSAEGEAPLGTLVRFASGHVYVSLAQPPAAGQVYQAWDIAEAPASMGTFAGRTYLSSGELALGHTFGVTLEPPGGSEQPTSTPLTLVEVVR
jgi:anti-sigma factor RsiW